MNVLDIANKNLFGMPRVRLFNTIFHLQKLMQNFNINVEFIKKTIFSFFHKLYYKFLKFCKYIKLKIWKIFVSGQFQKIYYRFMIASNAVKK